MNIDQLRLLLNNVKKGDLSIEKAINKFKTLPYQDIDYAKIDNHREIRTGYPEVIYCQGKTKEHLQGIIIKMVQNKNMNILATRVDDKIYEAIKEVADKVKYYPMARIAVINKKKIERTKKKILIITGGTSDIQVAEEAAITAEVFGNPVERLYDVGVAGLHRLLSNLDKLKESNVLITVAGMEGALASVVGGLVDKPIIAVPTSIGYGANFGGLSALLSMLNSCSAGVSVVNIDNGFGAGYLASMINNL